VGERIELTELDLLEAVLAANAGPDATGALSVYDLAEQTGHCENWVRARLRRLERAGRLEVLTVPGRRLDGHRCVTPVYRLKGER
jgi:DNA-binding Lrp family transcriptional regulator